MNERALAAAVIFRSLEDAQRPGAPALSARLFLTGGGPYPPWRAFWLAAAGVDDAAFADALAHALPWAPGRAASRPLGPTVTP